MGRAIALSCLTLVCFVAAGEESETDEACCNLFRARREEYDEVSMMQKSLELDVQTEQKEPLLVRSIDKEEVRGTGLHRASAGKKTTTTTTTLDFGKILQDVRSKLAKINDISLNTQGDLVALISSLKLDIGIVAGCFLGFMVLARYFPNIYAFRATGAWGQIPDAPFHWLPAIKDYEWLRWVRMSLHVSVDQVVETCGLDSAFLIQYTVLSMEIMILIGIPNLVILSMLYCFPGGDPAGDDHLSYIGIGNVEYGSWVFWVVAFMVWYNVVIIQYRLVIWQLRFIKFRTDWLKRMPSPQDTTVLVEGIAPEFCTDAKLKEYFQAVYGKDEVLEAFVVKRLGTLQKLISDYKRVDLKLNESELLHINVLPGHLPDRMNPTWTIEEKKSYYTEQKQDLTIKIIEEQKRVRKEAQKPSTNLYCNSGFVTFRTRARTEQALAMRLRVDIRSFSVSLAPDPADVIYTDLQKPWLEADVMQIIGYCLVFGLAILYMPIVIGISNLANMDNLRKIQIIRKIFDYSPALEGLIEGQLPSLGLTIMTSLLPTFLMLIFENFFYLRAHRWAQYELQAYYFWFQVFFVILVTAIGSSLIGTLSDILDHPFHIFDVLADMMPLTTHFYMNFMILQWVSNALNLLRYINLAKYLIYQQFYDKEQARELAEPEDQNSSGMGSRSARFSIHFTVGFLFGTISPLITVFTFINFALCRLIYGYLIPFAESRKDDLGGWHFVRQLHHVHSSLFLYICLMVGILSQRADGMGPATIATLCLFWWGFAWYRFESILRWRRLAFEEVALGVDPPKKRTSKKKSYLHPELDPNIFERIERKSRAVVAVNQA